MALIKIMAVYMHETELVEAMNIIRQKGQQVKESFVIGYIEEDQIEKIRSKGLITSVIDPSTPVDVVTPSRFNKAFPTSGFSNVLSTEHKNLYPLIQEDLKEPNFYLITLVDPLLDDYLDLLKKIDIEIIERISPNNYTSYFKFNDLVEAHRNARDKYSFIVNVKLYDENDTGAIFNQLILLNNNEEKKLVQVDLLLHREKDLEQSVAWLRAQQIEIIASRFRKIRIQLPYNEDVFRALARYKFIKNIEQFVTPKFQNNVAREILMIESTTGGSLVKHISQTGEGEFIGVADTGIDYLHPDFGTSIVKRVAYGRADTGDTSDPIGHGTHVTGSIVGSGISSGGKIKGTAPDAKVFFQSLLNARLEITLPTHLQDLFQEAYNEGVRIHNNSWGSETPSTYTINSLDVDEFVYTNKDMLIVISAGNQGDGAHLFNVEPGLVELGSVGAPATAKNALTIGASRSTRVTGGYSTLTYGVKWKAKFPHAPLKDEKISGNKQGLAGFSSRGPTAADYRIKPDLVAPGTDIISLKSSTAPLHKFWGPDPSNASYAFLGGTSMAAPLVAGCAALVRQFYRQVKKHTPSASLLKATLINGTDQLFSLDALGGHPHLPNYHQGFGLLNMTKTIPNNLHDFTLLFRDTWENASEHFVRGSQRFRYTFFCDKKGWLRVCLTYTDFPVLAIQNKLQIILEHIPTKTKWTGNANRPVIQPVLPGNSTADNVQIIRVDSGEPGAYLIQIYAEILLKPPQDFAVVITGGELNDHLNPY